MHLPDLRTVLISCVVFAAGGIVFGLFLVYGMERLFGLSLGIAKTPINVIRIAVAFFFWFVLFVGVLPLLRGGRWGTG
ncbi:MAG: hypothetical protein AB1609_20305 [Bacillota bacterium]